MASLWPWESKSRNEDLSEVEKAVIGDTVPVETIESVEKEYKAKQSLGQVTDDVTFAYSLHLVKSPYSNDIKKGITLLKELCQKGKDQRDYLFYIGLGSYRLEDYTTARSYIERMLNFEPQNRQAKQLEQLINRKQHRDGLLGIALVGGTAVVASAAAVIFGFALAKATK